MTRDDWVEMVMDVIGRNAPCVMTRDEARSLARGALAVIEPAVREDCIAILRKYDPWTSDDYPPPSVRAIRAAGAA